MKKILFCLQTLTRGGVEKELLTILDCFPREEYEITVLYFYDSDFGVKEEFAQKRIKLVNLDIDTSYHCGSTVHIMLERLHKGRIWEAAEILLLQGLKMDYTGSILSQAAFPGLDGCYDIAIAYNMHSPMVVKYVAQKVDARKKYVWIHTDCTASGFNPRRLKRYLSSFDLFVGCSAQVTKEFLESMPQFGHQSVTCTNIVDQREIREKATYTVSDLWKPEESQYSVLTIGRYEPEKGYEYAIRACSKLINAGFDIKWYAIGWGQQETMMRRLVLELDLETRFVLMGKRENPYPYLNACTIYAQPSTFEGFGLVIAEAKALNKPIVATDFAGAREQLVDHETGTIVPVGDVEKLATAIEELLLDESLRKRYSQNLEIQTNEEDIKKLLAIF